MNYHLRTWETKLSHSNLQTNLCRVYFCNKVYHWNTLTSHGLVRFPNEHVPVPEIPIEKRKALHKLIAERNRRTRSELHLDWETRPVFREHYDEHDYSDDPSHGCIRKICRPENSQTGALKSVKSVWIQNYLKLLRHPYVDWVAHTLLLFTSAAKAPFLSCGGQQEARKWGYRTTCERRISMTFVDSSGGCTG